MGRKRFGSKARLGEGWEEVQVQDYQADTERSKMVMHSGKRYQGMWQSIDNKYVLI